MAMGRKEKGRRPDYIVRAALQRGVPQSMRTIGAAWNATKEGEVKMMLKLELLPMTSGWDGSLIVREPFPDEKVPDLDHDPETGEVA
jgi:hypothetical protein